MVLAVVLSQVSTKSEIFKFYLESTIMYLLHKKLNKVIVPLLINDCDVPQCLVHFEPLMAFEDKNKWLPKLLRVLDLENMSSSSAESDDELSEAHDKLLKILAEKNFRKQKIFRKNVRNLFCLHILAGQADVQDVHKSRNSDDAIVEIEKLKKSNQNQGNKI